LAHIRISLPPGVNTIGDIEGAFIRAGASREESAGIFIAFVESTDGIGFRYKPKQVKSGLDLSLLVRELREAGFNVDWSEESDANAIEAASKRRR
jgi:hypothetical protein